MEYGNTTPTPPTPSKEKARTCIMMNGVELAGKLENKAGKQINKEKFFLDYENNPEHLKVDDKLLPYVSRGAFKLEEAYKKFSLSFKDKIVLDIGSSTGGFTDFALKNGAKKSYALDVGKG
jgi:23S rRNA (cytidine1920-2'-O)/16S rRNA (cytidine1409-2'-O)-methyltransferase